MGFAVASLWGPPEVNPVNHKARQIPAFNPFNKYGRVFLVSWWGFFIAFWSWFAFPPLLTDTIKEDLKLSQSQVANSSIVSVAATLLVRLTAGTACDRFGARWVFAVLLLAGAIPTALAGAVNSVGGLIAIRFFIGILGGSIVPCQIWTTGFFDKNVVGTATSLTAGLGNAGGGITYFVMPAIFDSLVSRQGLSDHAAWRVAFVVPFILIITTALIIIFLCPDTPTGPWSSRALDAQRQMEMRDTFLSSTGESKENAYIRTTDGISNDTIKLNAVRVQSYYTDAQAHEEDLLAAASWELVEKPTYQNSAKTVFSLPTLTLCVVHFCSFGGEICINQLLGAYYAKNFPALGQTGSGTWAAIYGLLNAVFRPAGGIMSDVAYHYTQSLWAKKMLIHAFIVIMGAFLMIIGFEDPHSKAVMLGLMTGVAFFQEAANGQTFSLVPHVHPTSTGLVTGMTAAAGDLGGLVFLLITRYDGTDYAKSFWVIGAITIGANILVSWIRPLPTGQLGGR